jgi:hypothetical protein
MNYRIIITEEQYDLLTLTLKTDIENEGDVNTIRELIKILDVLENEYHEV